MSGSAQQQHSKFDVLIRVLDAPPPGASGGATSDDLTRWVILCPVNIILFPVCCQCVQRGWQTEVERHCHPRLHLQNHDWVRSDYRGRSERSLSDQVRHWPITAQYYHCELSIDQWELMISVSDTSASMRRCLSLTSGMCWSESSRLQDPSVENLSAQNQQNLTELPNLEPNMIWGNSILYCWLGKFKSFFRSVGETTVDFAARRSEFDSESSFSGRSGRHSQYTTGARSMADRSGTEITEYHSYAMYAESHGHMTGEDDIEEF